VICLFDFTLKGMCVPSITPQIYYRLIMSQNHSMLLSNRSLIGVWTETEKQLVTIRQSITYNVGIFFNCRCIYIVQCIHSLKRNSMCYRYKTIFTTLLRGIGVLTDWITNGQINGVSSCNKYSNVKNVIL